MSSVTRLTAVSALIVLVAAFALPAGAQESVPAAAAEGYQNWFIQLASAPAADGTSLTTLKAEKDAFRAAARKAGLKYNERYAFDTLWNGVSVSADSKTVAAMARLNGVSAVFPVVTMDLPPREVSSDPELFTAVTQTHADQVWNELGYTGAGIKVAIIDSGLNYYHPDLGGCFGPGCKVAYGWDFVGDNYDAAISGSTPVPDADPNDCTNTDPAITGNSRFAGGHGTHVSGIVGANGAVKGVAPGVTLGIYRVFGCVGSTSADIMIAAMERALADGMQVINMSIGSSFQWPQYPTAVAANNMVNKGISVVTSIGNSGASGLYSSSAPGVGEKVIGVAAFNNTYSSQLAFSITPDGMLIGYNRASGGPLSPTSGTYPMAKTGTPTTTNDACNPLPAGSLAGKIALIRRGTCSFYQKSKNAEAAGAIGVVLYNNTAGPLNPTVAGTPPVVIPVVAVSDVDGVLINNRIASGPVDLTWTDQVKATPLSPSIAGLISSFSSYGLAPDLSFKPDLGAPGGSIWSTYPIVYGSYASLSGTSMSSPHTAGAVALLLEALPSTPSNAIRGILQNNAVPQPWSGNPGLGLLDSAHRQGAGMLDIYGAITSTTKISPSKLALGESEVGPAVRTLTLTNNGTEPVTYELGNIDAIATANEFPPHSYFLAPAAVSFSSPSVLVPAGGSASVDVTITANAGLPDLSIYGGYITVSDGEHTQVVPYGGLKGDYQTIQAITPLVYGFPWLAKLSGGNFFNQPGGATYTLAGGDNPWFLLHLDHAVRTLRFEVFDANTSKAWHRAFDYDYVGRNTNRSSTQFFFSFEWNGTTSAGNKMYVVPNGQYVMKISVLKALGDATNPAHWETWTSPVITIARP